MRRQEARYSRSGGIEPGRLLAMRADGQTIVSDYLASPNARRIQRVYEYEGQIAIELTAPSTGDRAFSTGEALHVRLGGWDGATNMLHRAIGYDMMDGDVLRDPYTAAPSPTGVNFGGAPKIIDVIDAKNIVIRDEPWKVRAEDPEPFFTGQGQVHRKSELVDIRGWLDDAFTWNDEEPFFSITMGAGIFVLKPGDTPELVRRVFYVPPHFTLRGAGRNNTYLFRDDYYNAISFYVQYYGCTFEDYTQDSNRTFQKFATHGYKVTIPVDGPHDLNVHAYARRRTREANCSGYGGNMGHPTSTREFEIVDNEFNGTGADCMDMKGPRNANLEGLSYKHRIRGNRFKTPGILYYGTNRTRPLALGTDPITTNGTSSVVVKTSQKPYRGQRITFAADTPDQDGVVFAGRSFKVTARGKSAGQWNATIDISPQVATGSSTGGGSGVEITMPACNKGKPAFDGRGHNLMILDNFVSGWLLRNRAGRIRGRDGSNGNGAGGYYTHIGNLQVVDETPASLGYTDARGLMVLAPHAVVTGYTCQFNGTGGALQVGATADGFNGSGIKIVGAATAGVLSAPNMNANVQASGCTNGFIVDGANVAAVSGSLEDDPVTVTDGSSIVTLAWPSTDADRPAAGATFDLSGVDVDYGVDLNSDWVVIDDSNPNYITFDCSQPAVVTGGGSVTFGGEGATYEMGSTTINASGYLRLEMNGMGSTGTFGVDIGNKAAQGDIRIDGKYEGGGTAAKGFTGRVRWGAPNIGLPNSEYRVDLPTSGTATALTQTDGNTRFDLPATASGIVVVPLPARTTVTAGTRYKFLAKAGSGTAGIQLDANSTDVIVMGASSSSAGGTITSSTPGATLTLEVGETGVAARAFYVTASTGTWTLA